MKKTLLSLSLCLGFSLASAQDCTPILRDAQQAYNRGQLRTALRKLQDTELCDYDNVLVKQRQDLQRKIFNAIEQQRRDAVAAKEEAINARLAAQQEKAKADSALAVANRVLDKLYFYEEKFGLTLKNVAEEYQQPRYRYGFINRQGEEEIPFEFEEAAPFSREDGFARVKREGKAYLLDTTGQGYLLATSFEELGAETQALDLHESRPDSFPNDIGQYQNLEIILAYGNPFDRGYVHQLPPNIGSLRKLRMLYLYFNELSQLPPEFGQLSQLQTLDLHDNQLGQLPPEVAQLSQLKTLDLNNNYLQELPPQFGQLSQLQSLDLSYNQLSQLPPEFGQLNQSQSLDLSGNQLSQLPPEFGQLNQLQSLDLFGNQLDQLPPEFGQLSQLQTLDLSDNQLSQLPPEFGQLSQLQTLYLSDNQFSQLPPEFGQLSQLQTLDLNSNQLSQLPPEFGQLSQLQTLDLSGNQLSQLPLPILELNQLQNLFLGYNQLSTVPKGVCAKTILRIKPRGSPGFGIVNNPLTHLPDCYLDKFSKYELRGFANVCLGDSLYHVAYQTLSNLARRFPEFAEINRDRFLEALDAWEAEGISHEAFPKMRALLKPKE